MNLIKSPPLKPPLKNFVMNSTAAEFSPLDLNQGYHQITLEEQSHDLTAFAMSQGILRYTRLIFGMSPAAEIYQREIQ